MRIAILLIVLVLMMPWRAFAQSDKPLNCATEPIPKTFGGARWLVRSCDDIALLVLADSGTPAFPFYFLVYPSETDKGRFIIEGEGTGDKRASAAALAEIRELTETDVAALIAEIKQQKK